MKTTYNHKDLIDGCLRNDRKCQQELYDTFAPKMLAVCLRYAVTKHEAEDIMIEGFMQVFTHLDKYLGESSLEYWIRKIMVNKAISNFRSNKKRYDYDLIDVDVEIADSSMDIETSMTGREILNIMQEMPDLYKMVFNLRIFEEYSFKDISAELEMPETTARVYFLRAKNWITDRIRKQDIK
ncbi:MAG: sigma-70 family RNA polymerase sigma factor [Bacteroidales bacterium]|nr:sigma-70 family RNA polymerase sigma factor [Bacteroidales bacterium]